MITLHYVVKAMVCHFHEYVLCLRLARRLALKTFSFAGFEEIGGADGIL